MIFLISYRLDKRMFDERIAVEQLESWSKKRLKKFLTNVNEYDNLNKLFQTAKTKNLDN